MAIVPYAADFAGSAIRYAATASVQAIVKRIEHEIANLTPSQIRNFIRRLLPGKKNARKRNQVMQAISVQLRPGFSSNGVAKAYNVGVANTAPRFRSARGAYVVSNREFVRDIHGTDTFLTVEILAQPGNTSLFPWLSKIAPTHQSYRFKKLEFTFVPLAATDERGRVTMAFAIDPLDPAVLSKEQLFQYPNSTEGSVWASLCLNVTKEVTGKGKLYTRTGFVDNTDLKTYDAGRLIIATSGGLNSNAIGELFVDYEVELYHPVPTECKHSNMTILSAGANLDEENFLNGITVGQELLPVENGSWSFRRAPGTNRLQVIFHSIGSFVAYFALSGTTVQALSLNTIPLVATNEIELNHSRSSREAGTSITTLVFKVKKSNTAGGGLVGVELVPAAGTYTAVSQLLVVISEASSITKSFVIA